MAQGKKWGTSLDDKIREFNKTHTNKEIASALGCSIWHVGQRKSAMGLTWRQTPRKDRVTLTDQQVTAMTIMVERGDKVDDIAHALGVGSCVLSRIMKERGLVTAYQRRRMITTDKDLQRRIVQYARSKSIGAAAAKFGVCEGTVRMWVRNARNGRAAVANSDPDDYIKPAKPRLMGSKEWAACRSLKDGKWYRYRRGSMPEWTVHAPNVRGEICYHGGELTSRFMTELEPI